MFWNKQRPDRSTRRPRSDAEASRLTLETLETRQLMAYSAFGYSLPDLAVTGFTAPKAALGSYLAVDINVENRGASSLIEPTAIAPGSLSSADVINTSVQIYGSATPSGSTGRILLGTLTIPAIRQNSDFETSVPVILPASNAALASLKKFYVTLVVNSNRAAVETNYTNDIYRIPTPVTLIKNPLPNLEVVGFDIPATLQPGDVITPTIRIANFGYGDPGTQGTTTVDIVASLDKNFSAGDVIVGSYTIASLPGLNAVPTQTSIAAAQNLFQTPNENTTTLPAIKLPSTPGFYYLGIKIDPTHQINQTYGPTAALSDPVPVGPADAFLAPGSALTTINTAAVFPNLPVTTVNPFGLGQVPLLTTVTPVTTVTTPSSGTSPVTGLPVASLSLNTKATKVKHHK